MLQFLMDNPLLFVALVLIIMAGLAIFGFSAKKKDKKIEKVFPSAEKKETEQVDVNTNSEEVDDNPIEKKEEDSEDFVVSTKLEEETEVAEDKEKKKVKIFKEKLKPKVEQVFKKEVSELEQEASEEKETITSEITEEDLLGRMQFVKTSKTVSKLRTLSDEEKAQQLALEEAALSESVEQELFEEEKVPEKPRHFDHSRRLSRCIECGSVDELFCPHLSERYLNINSDKHLKIDENFEEALYARTTKMLANSGAKVLCDDDSDEEENYTPSKAFKNDKEYMKEWLEKRRREEFAKLVIKDGDTADYSGEHDEEPDLNLNTKTLIMAGSVMKRRSAKNKF